MRALDSYVGSLLPAFENFISKIKKQEFHLSREQCEKVSAMITDYFTVEGTSPQSKVELMKLKNYMKQIAGNPAGFDDKFGKFFITLFFGPNLDAVQNENSTRRFFSESAEKGPCFQEIYKFADALNAFTFLAEDVAENIVATIREKIVSLENAFKEFSADLSESPADQASLRDLYDATNKEIEIIRAQLINLSKNKMAWEAVELSPAEKVIANIKSVIQDYQKETRFFGGKQKVSEIFHGETKEDKICIKNLENILKKPCGDDEKVKLLSDEVTRYETTQQDKKNRLPAIFTTHHVSVKPTVASAASAEPS